MSDDLKKDDHYHYSIPFEYIVENNGGDGDEIGTAYMEVDVDWNDSEEGYEFSYYCPDMSSIDPSEGNGDEDEFFREVVVDEVLSKLASEGIYAEAICVGY